MKSSLKVTTKHHNYWIDETMEGSKTLKTRLKETARLISVTFHDSFHRPDLTMLSDVFQNSVSRSVRWSHVFYSCTSCVLLRATLLAFVAPISSRLSQLRLLTPVCLGPPEDCKLPSRSRDVILRESSGLKKEIRKYVSLASIELKMSWP